MSQAETKPRNPREAHSTATAACPADGGPIGVLLLNLGSPDEPEPPALKRYLRQFLGDPRVLEINPIVRWLLLNLIILPRRSKTSAELYRSIWSKNGSPLIAISERQAKLLGRSLGPDYKVSLVMRYGNPSIEAGVNELTEAGCRSIVLLTAFPQYSNTSLGTAYAEVFRVISERRDMPALQIVPPYYDAPEYLDAVADSIRRKLERFPADHLVLSYHGIPERYKRNGDPYSDHCEATTRGIMERLKLDPSRWTMTYQSRFGKEPWLQPYTDKTLEQLAKTTETVLVACPGFTADCLETIEEIAGENHEVYVEAGGKDLRLCPCLNSSSAWIEGMASLIRKTAPRSTAS